MTDRELLELAAKAAGLTILGEVAGRPGFDVLDNSRASGTRWWSPLTDDGDALRLAVKLKLDIIHTHSSVRAVARRLDGVVVDVCEIGQVTGAEGLRSVITMAAASIGKAMP